MSVAEFSFGTTIWLTHQQRLFIFSIELSWNYQFYVISAITRVLNTISLLSLYCLSHTSFRGANCLYQAKGILIHYALETNFTSRARLKC